MYLLVLLLGVATYADVLYDETALGDTARTAIQWYKDFNLILPKILGEVPDPNNPDIFFWVFTTDNAKKPRVVVLNENTDLTNIGVNWLLETKIFIHGAATDATTPWVQNLRYSYINTYGYNVVAVNWGTGPNTKYSEYIKEKTMFIASTTARFIRLLLKQTVMDKGMIHVVGHSLGCNIAAAVGKMFNGTLARITAFDPSIRNVDTRYAETYVTKDDAVFVDVIHTSIHVFGTSELVGDIDYFLNGGETQPGCESDINKFFEAKKKFGDYRWALHSVCAHAYVYKFFIGTVGTPPYKLLARRCRDYKSFQRGECGYCTQEDDSECAVFGALAKKPKVIPEPRMPYYLNTADVPLYFY